MAKYTKGFIAEGNGNLIAVTNIKVDTTNNGKQVHTLMRPNAGNVLGVEETTVTFDSVVSEDGIEKDYFSRVKNGTEKQIRVKIPGTTMTVDGIYKDLSFDLPLDDSIKLSMTFIGHMVD